MQRRLFALTSTQTVQEPRKKNVELSNIFVLQLEINKHENTDTWSN